MTRLRRATPAETAERDRLSHSAWAGGLPVHAHLAREAELRSGPWARAAHTMWVLEAAGGERAEHQPRQLHVPAGELLASCEAYAVPSHVDGMRGVTYEIASVYTEDRLRGRGHASALLAALAAQVGALPDTQAMLLFSDVGEAIYARLGFTGLSAWDRVSEPRTGALGRGVRFLAHDELDGAWAHARSASPDAGFRLTPSAGQLRWHLDEARLSASLAARPNLAGCGARLGDDLVVWALDPREDELLILDLRATDTTAPALWAAARIAAATAGLRAVRAWETADWPRTVGIRVPRHGHIPMIRPFAAFDPEEVGRVPRGVWV